LSSAPLVSIVTPSLDPGERLRRCIASVKEQAYPQIEHLVMDGGSTDGTLAVLESEPSVKWVSEPDSGQASAINKGFRRAEGTILGWLNADDRLTPGAVADVVAAFQRDERVGWVYGNVEILREGRREIARPAAVTKPKSWAARNFAAQPGSFNTRWALERVGYLDETFHYMMDFDLWLRMVDAGIGYAYVPRTLAVFEVHEDSKSGSVSHAEFVLEEGLARLRSGRLRTAAVAFGRAAAWKAFENGKWNEAQLDDALAALRERVGEPWSSLPQDLVEAGIAAERALLELKSGGLTAVRGLLSRKVWRYPETRSRVVHSGQVQVHRLWDRLTLRDPT
jgi:GT2 family glycosyltransferase